MRVTRAKAIRLKCLDCSGGQASEVKSCPCRKCPLWNYRMGREVDDEGKYTPRKTTNKIDSMSAKIEVRNDAD